MSARPSRLWALAAPLLCAACEQSSHVTVIAAEPGPPVPLGPRIAFWAISALIIGGALVTITRRNAVTAVMALVATFFGLAAMYTLLSAHFLAAVQVLVYAGAIMTLFVFVVMLLNREEAQRLPPRGIVTRAVGLALAVAMTVWLATFLHVARPERTDLPPEGWGGVESVGNVLFQDYLFPFEAISLLLLIAVIAAVVVARIPKPREAAAEPPAPTSDGGHA
jgi:NADH-quinone oxidoreductase subunit J